MESDETLQRRVQGGDMAAFDALYERYETRLFAYVRAVVGDRRDAEEILHDAFMSTLKAGGPAQLESGSFRAWLYRVARNLAFNRRRSAGRLARLHEQRAASAVEDARDGAIQTADRALEARELEVALASAVLRLPEPLGELYHLRTSGLSYEEIAGVVDVPLGTVKSRMHQMVQTLRQELKPWIAPE